MNAQFQPATPVSGKANSKGIAGMVCGIIGMVIWLGIGPFAVIFSILSLVLGMMGKKEIDASAGTQGGKGMAITAIVLGWVGIGFTILLVILIAVGISVMGGMSELQ